MHGCNFLLRGDINLWKVTVFMRQSGVTTEVSTLVIGHICMMALFYCQEQNVLSKCFLFKFVFSLGKKDTIGKISLKIEATKGMLVLVV